MENAGWDGRIANRPPASQPHNGSGRSAALLATGDQVRGKMLAVSYRLSASTVINELFFSAPSNRSSKKMAPNF
jgi:hypothetical protein